MVMILATTCTLKLDEDSKCVPQWAGYGVHDEGIRGVAEAWGATNHTRPKYDQCSVTNVFSLDDLALSQSVPEMSKIVILGLHSLYDPWDR